MGSGAAAIAGGHSAGKDDLAWAQGILEAVGTVVKVPEAALDAVTGLSGSGPAYVFLLAEALIDAGVQMGLTPPVAQQLVVQTLLGSARLLAETGDEPATLRAAVTSPGGTTAAGLRVLEAAGVRQAVLDAVAAATARSAGVGSTQVGPAFATGSHWRTLTGAEKGGATRVQPNEARSRFVTVAEVADQLRVSNMTVYRLVQAGQLPATRVGRSYRIREEDVDRYLAQQYTRAG